MCDFNQREYKCGHFRWICTTWCARYCNQTAEAPANCPPNVVDFETRDQICADCKPRQRSVLEQMFRPKPKPQEQKKQEEPQYLW